MSALRSRLPGVTVSPTAKPPASWVRRSWPWLRRGVSAAILVGGWLWLAYADPQMCGITTEHVTAPLADRTTTACRSLALTDPVVVGNVLLALLLLGPDLAEMSVPGLVSLKWKVKEQTEKLAAVTAAVETLSVAVQSRASSAAASTSAVSMPVTFNLLSPPYVTADAAAGFAANTPPVIDGSDDGDQLLAESRFAAAAQLLGVALAAVPEPLSGARLHLYYPDAAGMLQPVTDGPGTAAWPSGVGVVGQAWRDSMTVVLAGGELQEATASLGVDQLDRYGDLTSVAAVPVLNAAGRCIGVLSAATSATEPNLDTDAPLEALTLLAEACARVMIDILGWDDDSPDGGQGVRGEGQSPS